MKAVQVYGTTSGQEDQGVESFYEDVELAMGKGKTQYTVLMGDFNAKVGKKQARDHAVWDCGTGTRNNGGKILMKFGERNNLRIPKTFFRKQENGTWKWQSPNGENKM